MSSISVVVKKERYDRERAAVLLFFSDPFSGIFPLELLTAIKRGGQKMFEEGI